MFGSTHTTNVGVAWSFEESSVFMLLIEIPIKLLRRFWTVDVEITTSNRRIPQLDFLINRNEKKQKRNEKAINPARLQKSTSSIYYPDQRRSWFCSCPVLHQCNDLSSTGLLDDRKVSCIKKADSFLSHPLPFHRLFVFCCSFGVILCTIEKTQCRDPWRSLYFFHKLWEQLNYHKRNLIPSK